MRVRLVPVFLLMTMTCLLPTASVANTVLSTTISQSACQQPVQMVLSQQSPTEVDGDEFNGILFRVGSRSYVFTQKSPQIRIKPSPLNPPYDFSKIKKLSLDKSGYFLRTIDQPGDSRSLFFFLGWPYASDPGSFFAVAVQADCLIRPVFNSETFELTDLEERPSLSTPTAGAFVLIGKHSLSQVMAGADGAWRSGRPYATTYDPYAVYVHDDGDQGSAKYSAAESERYNRTHYCWAGSHSSETISVVFNRQKPGGMECINANRARDLIR